MLVVSDPAGRAGALALLYLAGYIGMTIPVVGLGVLVQHIAAHTSLLIFGSLLVAGVCASARPLLRHHQPSGRQHPRVASGTGSASGRRP